MKLITVCVPAYEMRGQGYGFLKHNLDILSGQTFKDFDVVVCDNSKNDDLKKLCEEYSQTLEIHYVSNPTGTCMASNLNFILQNQCATGTYLRILAQDDYLYDENSLELIAKNIKQTDAHWLINALIHTKDGKNFFKPIYPRYNSTIYLGNNTIGGLSVLTIKNDSPALFSEDLLWLVDCEYYKRCYDTYGPPVIINDILTVVRLGEYSVTNTEATLLIRKNDFDKMLKKYETGYRFLYYKIVNQLKYPAQKIKLGILKKIWQKY